MPIQKIAVVDLETTGSNYAEGDRIIQLAAVIIEDGQITARHSMLINPERAIPERIVQLTGITQAQVDKAPTFRQVAELWFQRLKECFFVAHNLAFDLAFLTQQFQEVGIDTFLPEAMDSVRLAKVFLPQASGFNLTDLAKDLALPFNNAHDALADAQVTAFILHELACRVLALPLETRIALSTCLVHFSHQEKLFLKYAAAFKLKEAPETLEEIDKISVTDATPTEHDYAQWLHESVNHMSQVVIEREVPLSIREQHAFLVKCSQPLLVIYSTLAQRQLLAEHLGATVIKKPTHYLSKEVFQAFLEAISWETLNQQELTVIAAAIYWLSLTQTGDLDELNQELTIVQLIQKYAPDVSFHHNSAYKQQLQRAMRQPIIALSASEAVTLLQQATLAERLYQRTLVVLDLADITEQLSYRLGTSLKVSEQFTQQRLAAVVDETFLDWQTLMQQLMPLVEESIAKTPHAEYVSVYLDYATLQTLPSDLLGELSEDAYWVVSAQVIQGQPFHIEMHQYVWRFAPSATAWLSNFKRSFLLCDGQYHFLQKKGLYARLQLPHEWHYASTMGSVKQQSVHVPISYAAMEEELQGVCDFLVDYEAELPDCVIVLAANRQAVVALTKQLQETPQLERKRAILSQGGGVSLRKIRRRLQHAPKSIVIVQRTLAIEEGWTGDIKQCAVLLQRLPFVSIDDARVQAQAFYEGIVAEHVFDPIVLPMMQANFVKTMQYIHIFLKPEQVYLMDERIYTKYYSTTVRAQLSERIDFEILL